MKTASLLQPPAALVPGRRDVDAPSTHSARYRLKSYLRRQDDAFAAIALAEAGDPDGAVDLLEKSGGRAEALQG